MIRDSFKRRAGDFFETVRNQTGQASPQKFGKAAVTQIKGQKKKGEKVEKGGGDSGKREDLDITEILGKSKISGDELKKLKEEDLRDRKEGIQKTRLELDQLKMQRYKEMQREILAAGKEVEEELPEHEAGKPGAPRTLEEKKEIIEKERKEAEKKKKEEAVVLPKSAKKAPGLGIFVKQKQGTGETKIGKKG